MTVSRSPPYHTDTHTFVQIRIRRSLLTALEKSAAFLADKGAFDNQLDNQLIDQYGYLKAFVTPEKIQIWNDGKKRSDERWVECFNHFTKNDIPFNAISILVQFIFALPGTSAPVELVFSIINKIWTSEKTRLQLDTLKNILYVKYNVKLECVGFFEYIKKNKKILQDISGQDKYEFKQKRISPETVELE